MCWIFSTGYRSGKSRHRSCFGGDCIRLRTTAVAARVIELRDEVGAIGWLKVTTAPPTQPVGSEPVSQMGAVCASICARVDDVNGIRSVFPLSCVSSRKQFSKQNRIDWEVGIKRRDPQDFYPASSCPLSSTAHTLG